MKVKAISLGYYQHKRRKPGEVFDLIPVKAKRDGKEIVILPEQQFSSKWMERLDAVKEKPKTILETPAPIVDEDKATGDNEVL